MADDFQQSGSEAPEVAIQNAGAEIAQMTGGGSKGTIAGGAQDAMADAVMTSMFVPLVKLAVAVADGLNGGKNNNKKGAAASHFVGGGAQRRPTPTPLVPMGYSEMKAAARRAARFGVKGALRGAGIFAAERLALVSQSVTGGGTADGKKTPVKGAKMAEASARLTKLTKSLSAALHAKEGVNRYDGSSARLSADLNKDSKLARKVVTVNPGIRPPVLSNSSAAS